MLWATGRYAALLHGHLETLDTNVHGGPRGVGHDPCSSVLLPGFRLTCPCCWRRGWRALHGV